jgi:hypothetical protein
VLRRWFDHLGDQRAADGSLMRQTAVGDPGRWVRHAGFRRWAIELAKEWVGQALGPARSSHPPPGEPLGGRTDGGTAGWGSKNG